MQVEHIAAAGTLMQAVHILGNQRQPPWVQRGPLGQRLMARVGQHLRNQLTPILVPAPDMGWIAPKTGHAGHLSRGELCPIAGFVISERRHARFSADARTGEYRHMLRLSQPLTNLSQLNGEVGIGSSIQASVRRGIQRVFHEIKCCAKNAQASCHLASAQQQLEQEIAVIARLNFSCSPVFNANSGCR